MNSKNNNEKEERRFCRICESYIKPRAPWDNPRRDPMYPEEWFCKTHWMVVQNALLSAHKRVVSELRGRADDKRAKRRINKNELMDLENIQKNENEVVNE